MGIAARLEMPGFISSCREQECSCPAVPGAWGQAGWGQGSRSTSIHPCPSHAVCPSHSHVPVQRSQVAAHGMGAQGSWRQRVCSGGSKRGPTPAGKQVAEADPCQRLGQPHQHPARPSSDNGELKQLLAPQNSQALQTGEQQGRSSQGDPILCVLVLLSHGMSPCVTHAPCQDSSSFNR